MKRHLLCLALAVTAAYAFVNDPGHVFTMDTHANASGLTVHVETYVPDQTPGHNIFNDTAQLDTAQIDTILPTDTVENGTETPLVEFDGVMIPEESPEGGHPDSWADNSPIYSDGWMLQVNDTTHITSWIAPTQDPTHTDIELGA